MSDSLPVIRIFFFGDSISFGQGVSPHRIWVTRVGETLSRTFEGQFNIVVQNPSINGNTTRMALERMGYDVQSHEPHVLITQFGMNDCNVWETDKGKARVSPEAFEANLGEIIDRGRNCGARAVIVGANHPTTRTRTPMPNVRYTYDEANRSYNQITRRVAEAKDTCLADLEMAFDACVAENRYKLADLLLPDELHLSELGHDVYYAHYLPLVHEAVTLVASSIRDDYEARRVA